MNQKLEEQLSALIGQRVADRICRMVDTPSAKQISQMVKDETDYVAAVSRIVVKMIKEDTDE